MARTADAKPGQVTVMLALFITVLCGVIALGVDVGYAQAQQRRLQNLSESAATAGLLALTRNSSPTDAQVREAINNNLKASSTAVQWDTGAPLPPGNLPRLRAEYAYYDTSTHLSGVLIGSLTGADGSTQPVPSMTVGGQTVAPNAIAVDDLSYSSPAFFAVVLGRKSFTVQAGRTTEAMIPPPLPHLPTDTPVPGATATPTATATGTPTGTATATNTPTPTSTATNTPTPTSTATMTAVPTPTDTSVPPATNTPRPVLCPASIALTSLNSNSGRYYTFTPDGMGDVTATWDIDTQGADGSVLLTLYRGTPPSLTAIDTQTIDAKDAKSGYTQTLDYATDKPGSPLPAGGTAYTIYFYNNTNQSLAISNVTVSYQSRTCTTASTATPVPFTPTSTPTPTPIPPAASSTPTPAPTGTATATSTPAPPTATATATPRPTATATPLPTIAPASGATMTGFSIWGGNPGGLTLGGDYNFWGHSWDSQVQGGAYDTTARFKGYIETMPPGFDPYNPTAVNCPPGSTNSSTCWSSTPGNSSSPPGSPHYSDSGPPVLTDAGCLPDYIDVMVITNATKLGGADYGGIAGIVEVKVDAPCSYAPDPGHAMNGMIVNVVWDPSHIVHTPDPRPIQVTQ